MAASALSLSVRPHDTHGDLFSHLYYSDIPFQEIISKLFSELRITTSYSESDEIGWLQIFRAAIDSRRRSAYVKQLSALKDPKDAHFVMKFMQLVRAY